MHDQAGTLLFVADFVWIPAWWVWVLGAGWSPPLRVRRLEPWAWWVHPFIGPASVFVGTLLFLAVDSTGWRVFNVVVSAVNYWWWKSTPRPPRRRKRALAGVGQVVQRGAKLVVVPVRDV